jgi:7-cyano-7-deazaguanine synthase
LTGSPAAPGSLWRAGKLPLEHSLLLSGGLDSATLAAWIKEQLPGEPVVAYTFLYGQKHAVELEAALAVANHYDLEHHVTELPVIRGSALTDGALGLPLGRDLSAAQGVAPSYVPARNLLLLSHVAALSDAKGPAVIWLGVHHDDHTGYPDCRPEFVEAADQAVRLGTEHGLRVRPPFVSMTKADIIRWGLEHQVPYHLTHSCYQGLRPACGVCDSCQARLAAFAAAGATDPIAYEKDRAGLLADRAVAGDRATAGGSGS